MSDGSLKRPSIQSYFMTILQAVSARSTCPRRSVGAVVVDEQRRILSTGYNGVPRKFAHCTTNACPGAADEPGNTSKCMSIHAEVNAILQCKDLESATELYVSCTPCFQCAKIIANTPIRRVYVLEDYADTTGKKVLQEAGVILLQWVQTTDTVNFLK